MHKSPFICVPINLELIISFLYIYTIDMCKGSGRKSCLFGENASGQKTWLRRYKCIFWLMPNDVAVDADGNIYVADAGNNKIRKIITQTGAVSTFAGSGNHEEKDGTGTDAGFASPMHISIDSASNLYVADYSSDVGEYLRMITPAGVVSTLCTQCLREVGGIVVDPAGHNVYATEYYTSVIDQISIY
jgi:DNA-binding beta-propeller fold protein YncE